MKNETLGHNLFVMAEDDEDHFLLAREALMAASVDVKLERVEDGVDLMHYLLRKGSYQNLAGKPLPQLILLDLNMPRKDGREALVEIKSDPLLKSIPLVILTTSLSEEDVAFAKKMGVEQFVRKPVHFSEYVKIMGGLKKYLISS